MTQASMTRAERIQYWRDHIQGHVEGWVEADMWRAIEVAGDILEEDGVTGPVAEFGVHHGLFLFLIDALRNSYLAPPAPPDPDNPTGSCIESAYAIGIWDDPGLQFVTPGPGWDQMQNGALIAFKRNCERFMPSQQFKITVADTFSISAGDFREAFSKGAKFFSIDAGHTPENAINDLSLVQEIMAPGGIVALDDFLNPYWSGVTEGLYRFMSYHNRRLRPFMFFRNKLFLTTISEHRDHAGRFGERMADLCDMRTVCGYDCAVEKPRGR